MTVSQKSSTALGATLQVKASPGTLYRLYAYNDKGSAQYVALYNTAAAPTSEKPIFVLQVASKGVVVFDFADLPVSFTAGIFVGNSSTSDSYTAGSADCYFFAQYL